MDDLDAYIFVVQFFQRRYDCADGALYVALDDEIEVLDFALLNLAEKLFERGARVSGEDLFSELLFSVFGDFLRDLILFDRVEFVASFRYFRKSENLDRAPWPSRCCIWAATTRS